MSEKVQNWHEWSFMGGAGGLASFFWAILWAFTGQSITMIAGAFITGIVLGIFGYFCYKKYLFYKETT